MSGVSGVELCVNCSISVILYCNDAVAFPDVMTSVVTVSKCFLSVGFSRFWRKNLGFRFSLGFHDKRVVNFFMTRVIWHDFRHR